MKNHLLFFILIIAIFSGCAQLTYNKIEKTFSKIHDKPEFIEKSRKIIYHPKRTDKEIIQIIRVLGTYHQDNVNNFLKNELFKKYANKKEIQEEIFNAILSQQNPSNIDFFMQHILKSDVFSKTSKEQIINFGKKYFGNWKKHLYSDDLRFQKELLEMIKTLDEKPIDNLLDEYLSLKDEIKKGKILYYLLNFKGLTSKEISSFILNKKINDYKQISELIDSIGCQYLNQHEPLFINNNGEKNIINISKIIFTSFGDSSLISLSKIYLKLAKLENKKILFSICEELKSEKSYNLLKLWIKTSDSTFERKELIISISLISYTFPDVFVEMLGDDNSYYDVLQILPDYIKNNPSSLLKGFQKASDIAKIRLLGYFFDHHHKNVLIKIFPQMKYYDSYIRVFSVLKLFKLNTFEDYYKPFINEMILSNSMDEFECALEYAIKFKKDFITDIIVKYDSINTINKKKEYLVRFFENTDSETGMDLVITKYLTLFENNKHLSQLYGSVFINNENLFSNKINEYFSEESSDFNKKAFVNLLTLINNRKNADLIIISKLSKNYFFTLDMIDRMRIVVFMKKFVNKDLVKFFIENYEELDLIERNLLNTALQEFDWNIVKNHLEKLIYLGNNEDFYLIKDFFQFKYDGIPKDTDINLALAFYYFKTNDYPNAKVYLEQVTGLDKKDELLNLITFCEKSGDFSNNQRNKTGEIPTNPARIWKSLVDSIFTYEYIITHNNVKHPDKDLLNKRNNHLKDQLDILKNEFKNFFGTINKQDYDYELVQNFVMKILRCNYKRNLNCGNITFYPDKNKIFLEIDLKVLNLCNLSQILTIKNFILTDDKNVYKPIWIGEYYLKFNGKDRKPEYSILSRKHLNLTLIFEVNEKNESFQLIFRNDKLIDINTPLIIKLKQDIE